MPFVDVTEAVIVPVPFLLLDHRIARMNGGSNEDSNLGTLCDECHKQKTKIDYKIRKRRRLELKRREE